MHSCGHAQIAVLLLSFFQREREREREKERERRERALNVDIYVRILEGNVGGGVEKVPYILILFSL